MLKKLINQIMDYFGLCTHDFVEMMEDGSVIGWTCSRCGRDWKRKEEDHAKSD